MNILGQEIKENLDYGSNFSEYSKYRDVSYLGAFGNAVQENSLVGLLQYNIFDDSGYKPTDTYNADVGTKIISEEFNDIRPEYRRNIIESSKSESELRYEAKKARDRSLNRDYLESMGFGVTLATDMVSSLADVPVIAGVSMVSPFVGTNLMAGKMRAFATGATMSLAFDTLQDNYGAREITNLEKALGMAFSGSLNTLFAGKSARDIKNDILVQSMKDEIGITPQIERTLSKNLSEDEKKEVIKEAYETVKANKEENKNKRITDILLETMDKKYESGTVSKGSWSKARTDMEYLTKTSKSPYFRELATSTLHDLTLQNNNLDSVTIMELKDAYESIGLSMIQAQTTSLNRKLSKYKTKSFSDYFTPKFLDESQNQASEILGKIQSLRNNGLASDDAVLDIAKSEYIKLGVNEPMARELAEESLKTVKNISEEFGKLNLRFKDNSFSEDMVTDSYLPNVYTFSGGEKLLDNGFSRQDIDDYFYNAIKSFERLNAKEGKFKIASPEKEQALRKVAKELAQFLGFRNGATAGMEMDSSRLFKLALERANLTKAEMKELSELLLKKETGGSSYMKRRMPLDRSYIHRTADGRTISINDFISNDLHEVFTKYAREQSGKIAGQKFKIYEDIIDEKTLKQAVDDEGNPLTREYSLGTWEGVELARARIAKELDDIRANSAENIAKIRARYEKGDLTKSEMNKLIKENTISDSDYKAELLRYDYLTYHLHGKPTAGLHMTRDAKGNLVSATDGAGNMNKVQQALTALNSFRLLGATPFTMVSELNNVAYYSGVSGIVNSLKMFPEMVRFYTSGEFKNKAFQEAVYTIGYQADFMHTLRPSMYDSDFSTSMYRHTKRALDRAIDKGLNISEKLAQFTLHLGGMIPFQTGLQSSVYSGHILRLKRFADGNYTDFDKVVLKEAGLSIESAKKIGKLINDNEAKNGGVNIGFDNWDDESKMLFTVTTRRLTDTIVQKPTIGGKIGVSFNDKLIGTSITGRFLLELKQYMYQSYVKQLGRTIESKSAYHYLMSLSQAGVIMAFYFPEVILKSGGDIDYINEKLKPENLVHETVSRMTVMGMPMMLAGAGSRATIGENIFNPYAGQDRRISNAILNSTPSVDLVNTLLDLTPATFDAIFGEENSGNRLAKDLYKLSPNILPVQFGYRYGKSYFEE